MFELVNVITYWEHLPLLVNVFFFFNLLFKFHFRGYHFCLVDNEAFLFLNKGHKLLRHDLRLTLILHLNFIFSLHTFKWQAITILPFFWRLIFLLMWRTDTRILDHLGVSFWHREFPRKMHVFDISVDQDFDFVARLASYSHQEIDCYISLGKRWLDLHSAKNLVSRNSSNQFRQTPFLNLSKWFRTLLVIHQLQLEKVTLKLSRL